MSGDFYFLEGTVDVEVFKKQMRDNGVVIENEKDRVREGDRWYCGEFRMTFDNKNYVFGYTGPETPHMFCLTRYGSSDSTRLLELLARLEYTDEGDREPNEVIHL